MSFKEYDDNCPDCKPAMRGIDPTGRMETEPLFEQEIEIAWSLCTTEERAAFHRLTCLNSREPNTLRLAARVVARIKATIEQTLHPQA